MTMPKHVASASGCIGTPEVVVKLQSEDVFTIGTWGMAAVKLCQAKLLGFVADIALDSMPSLIVRICEVHGAEMPMFESCCILGMCRHQLCR